MSVPLAIEGVGACRGNALAVRDVTLAAQRGTWFGLIGANGSGKTTLLRAVAGRLDIAEGQCWIDGVDLSRDRRARAAAIGFAPTAAALPAALSAREILTLAARGAGDPLASLGSLGDALGISALLPRRIGHLSAGMRQRVAIACAFVGRHSTVILDEPFNWLDPVAAYDLRAALRARVKAGLTLITALHDLSTLAASCDEGLLLSTGRIALTLSGEDLYKGRTNLTAFEHHMIQVLRGGDALLTPADHTP
jgi:ABC-type multidrug transport system ATPase subunit